MSKKRKSKKSKGPALKASDRVFYRNPWVMFAEFAFSAPGMILAVLIFGFSVAFISLFA